MNRPNVLRSILARIGVGRGDGGNGGNDIDTSDRRSRDSRSKQQVASDRRLQQQHRSSASSSSSTLVTLDVTDPYHCDYASIGHAISTKSNEWHVASCVYVTILSALGILLVVSLFWSAKRSNAAARAATSSRGEKSNGYGRYHRGGFTEGRSVPRQRGSVERHRDRDDMSTISGITDEEGNTSLNYDDDGDDTRNDKNYCNSRNASGLGPPGEFSVAPSATDSSTAAPPLFPPNATEAEVARFVRARKGDIEAGSIQLRHYLDWRKRYEDVEERGDLMPPGDALMKRCGESDGEYDWRMACAIAQVAHAAEVEDANAHTATDEKFRLRELPCVVFLESGGDTSSHRDGARSPTSEDTPPVRNTYSSAPTIAQSPPPSAQSPRSLDGARICHHIPARIDTSLASGQIYATALALYLDRRLSRSEEEKFDVVIDTRPGLGWANISAYHLVPFIRHASKLLNDLHPERLHRAIVYPVPSVCAFIWNRLVRPFMDPTTAEKIVVLGGGAKITSKVPKGMRKYIGEDALGQIERRRLGLFSSSEGKD